MGGGLGFLHKKGFHTGSMANQEAVWKAEQQAMAEKAKLDEIKKQIAEERQVMELQDAQVGADGKKKRKEAVKALHEKREKEDKERATAWRREMRRKRAAGKKYVYDGDATAPRHAYHRRPPAATIHPAAGGGVLVGRADVRAPPVGRALESRVARGARARTAQHRDRLVFTP